jgi:hypothetical protein
MQTSHTDFHACALESLQSKNVTAARVDLIGAHSFLPPSAYINLTDFQFGKTVRIANQVLTSFLDNISCLSVQSTPMYTHQPLHSAFI